MQIVIGLLYISIQVRAPLTGVRGEIELELYELNTQTGIRDVRGWIDYLSLNLV